EVLVPPRRERLHLRLHVVGLIGVVGASQRVDADRAPGEVAVEVGVGVARTEVLGPGALHLQQLVGQGAGVVLAAGVALAVDDALDVGAGDVGDALGGAHDRGLVPTLERRRRDRRAAGAVAGPGRRGA